MWYAIVAVVVVAAAVVVAMCSCFVAVLLPLSQFRLAEQCIRVLIQVTIITYFRLLDAEIYILFPYRFDFGKSFDNLLIVNKMLKQLYRKPRIGLKDPLYADIWLNLKVA